jgi:hypothetical protein
MTRGDVAGKAAEVGEAAAGGGVPGPQDLIVLLHVPKTAGTSLTLVLKRNQIRANVAMRNVFKGGGVVVDPPGYDLIRAAVEGAGAIALAHGHVPLAVADYFPAEWSPRYVTFLRDPVDRAVSHYFQILNLPRNVPVNGRSGLAPEDGGAEEENGIGPPREPLRAEVPYELALSDLRYVPDNLHTRMLCGDPAPFGEVTETMLERAKRNLEHRVSVFGLAEQFDESMVLFGHRLGFRALLAPSRRLNALRPRGEEIPADLVAAARRTNRFDIELYEFARDLFERAPERRTLEYQIDLAAFRQALAEDAQLPEPQPPPPDYPGDEVGWSMLLRARVDALRAESKLAGMRRNLVRWSALQQRAQSLADEIAVQSAHLDRMRIRRKSDARLEAPQRAELKLKAAKVRERHRELLSQQADVQAQLRVLGTLGARAGQVQVAGAVDEVITRKRFAALVGIPLTTVQEWENARIVRPAWQDFVGIPWLVFSEDDVEFGRRLAARLRQGPKQMTLARAAALARRPSA